MKSLRLKKKSLYNTKAWERYLFAQGKLLIDSLELTQIKQKPSVLFSRRLLFFLILVPSKIIIRY